jgi:hypothetical protein
MDPELAASVLPRLESPWYAFRGMKPQYAVMILSLLSSADVGRVLALSPEWSISPDPLDKVLDYLQPDQVEDYLSRISPGRALKLLAARGQDRADRFFDQLEPETAASVFNEMGDEAAAAWLIRADPDRAALVLEKASPRPRPGPATPGSAADGPAPGQDASRPGQAAQDRHVPQARLGRTASPPGKPRVIRKVITGTQRLEYLGAPCRVGRAGQGLL